MNATILDFAYKYPFSKEAKEVVQNQPNKLDVKYMESSGKHLENAMEKGIGYSNIKISSIKLDYVMAYLYSRMLLSAVKRIDLIRTYSIAEAKRSGEAMLLSDNSEIIRIASELGLNINQKFDVKKTNAEEYTMSFIEYVNNSPSVQSFELVNQKLSSGIVLLDKNKLVRVLEEAIAKEIRKGLPVKSSELPKEILNHSKTLKFKSIAVKTDAALGKRSEEWIEKLLQTPIADVRHRTVNLILAPYLVNTTGLEVEAATKVIAAYIEKCKEIDPTTKVNERYINYQCDYAKRKGSKPMSFDRAKELLGNQIEFESESEKRV